LKIQRTVQSSNPKGHQKKSNVTSVAEINFIT